MAERARCNGEMPASRADEARSDPIAAVVRPSIRPQDRVVAAAIVGVASEDVAHAHGAHLPRVIVTGQPSARA